MTYCFGFHHGSSVFLFADSVVTGAGRESSGKTTSYGQVLSPAPGESFGETGTKIARAADNCLVAISGDMRRAYDAIEALGGLLRTSDDLQGAIRAIRLSSEVDHADSFQLLIAHCVGTELKLWHWESTATDALECSVDGLWMIGMAIPVIDTHLTGAAKVMRSLPLNDDTMLSFMAGTYQSALLQALTVAQGQGVGGLVLGARLDTSGIHWLRDTNYVVYGDVDAAVDLIQVRHREGGFAVSSPNLEHMQLCVWNRDAVAWQEQWAKPLFESIFHRQACNWMFISYLGFGGVLIQDTVAFDVCHVFDARIKVQGLTHIALLDNFCRLLSEVIRRQEAPQFVYAHRTNSLQVLAQALHELQGSEVAAVLQAPPMAKRLEAKSSKWDYKPFPRAEA
jgi:hypothetical protein